MPKKRSLRQEERGQAQVEMALSLMTILVVLFMTIELSSAIYTYVVLSDAANEGLRYAIVNSSDSGGAATRAKVVTYAANSLHDMSDMTVNVNYPDGQLVPGRVQISVSYPYLPYLGFMGSPPTMHAYAEGRLVY
jgi:Flp pilus assembly protein TadG